MPSQSLSYLTVVEVSSHTEKKCVPVQSAIYNSFLDQRSRPLDLISQIPFLSACVNPYFACRVQNGWGSTVSWGLFSRYTDRLSVLCEVPVPVVPLNTSRAQSCLCRVMNTTWKPRCHVIHADETESETENRAELPRVTRDSISDTFTLAAGVFSSG